MSISKTLLLFCLPAAVLLASPGPTDRYGCHQCWEDCEEYGLEYGEYHCHDPQPGEDMEEHAHSRHEIHPVHSHQDYHDYDAGDRRPHQNR